MARRCRARRAGSLVGVGGGIVRVTLAGWLVTRRVAQMSPLQVLLSVYGYYLSAGLRRTGTRHNLAKLHFGVFLISVA
ncbi:MAG: hypothetical protein WAU04_06960 [Candidatus Nitrotoga sp.]